MWLPKITWRHTGIRQNSTHSTWPQDEGEQSLHIVIGLLPEKSPLPTGQTEPTDGLDTTWGGEPSRNNSWSLIIQPVTSMGKQSKFTKITNESFKIMKL
jgi:hypothetical protein